MAEKQATFNISQGGFNNIIVTTIIVVLFTIVTYMSKTYFDMIISDLKEIKIHTANQEILNVKFATGIEANKNDIQELKEIKEFKNETQSSSRRRGN